MNNTQKPKSKTLKLALGLLLLFGLGFWVLPLPDFQQTAYSTILEARDGTLLGARIAADGQWRFPAADSVPLKFEQALLQFEDAYFYRHPGINPVSILKALKQNIRSGTIRRGGSTLSMQLIRLARHNPSRTIPEKLLEMLLAMKLEFCYSKKEILNLWVTLAPFGGNVVGLPAASWRYYGRPPEQLSWGEYAVLAVLPNSPSLVYPGKNSPRLLSKRNRLLDKLQEQGIIDAATCRLAQAEPLPGQPKPLPDLASHLMDRASKEQGKGKRFRTTLEAVLQKKIYEKVLSHHQFWRDNHVYNAAALLIEVKSGKTLAYIGNVDGDGLHGQYVDIIASNRSTGSLLKPLLYAAAMDEGLILPQQLLPDVPLFLQGFSPQNFDKKFHGAVAADQALARSYNIPFVHLLQSYGYEKFHQKLQKLGIHSLDKPASYYGLSMILGGAESSLWETTATYAGLVRSLQQYPKRPLGNQYSAGDYHPNQYLLNPPNSSNSSKNLGATLNAEPESAQPFNSQGILNAWSIGEMLQAMQTLNRPQEQAGWESFASSRSIAWKTGTSYGFKDAWAIGMTPEYVVGVWLGNADGEGRPELTGSKAAAPLMFDIFRDLPESSGFMKPYQAKTLAICRQSGYKAGPNCPEKLSRKVASNAEQTDSCPFHQLLHLDASGTYQVNSTCYPLPQMQHKDWFILPAVQAWYYKQYQPTYTEPPEWLDLCLENKGQESIMEFIYPRHFTRLYVPTELDGSPGAAVFEMAHRNPREVVFWHLDGQYAGQTSGKHQMALNPAKGNHTLSLVDAQGRELSLTFEVISDRQ